MTAGRLTGKKVNAAYGACQWRWTEDAAIFYEELSVDESEILSYDVNLYNYDRTALWGEKKFYAVAN